MEKKKILLHSCCGPCSTSVVENLVNYFDVSIFFYNPNIFPREEYEKRLSTEKLFCEKLSIKIIEGSYDHDEWLKAVAGLEGEREGEKRCEICFNFRLAKTASLAKEKGFDLFSTTLSVSPHKSFSIISHIGKDLEAEFGVKFLDRDFKKGDGFKRSIDLSKEHSLYRQKYCGCEFSVNH